jgi:hypothetical protein
VMAATAVVATGAVTTVVVATLEAAGGAAECVRRGHIAIDQRLWRRRSNASLRALRLQHRHTDTQTHAA